MGTDPIGASSLSAVPSSSASPSSPVGPSYEGQARGGADAYAAYYAGMDRSMQQKVALTTAYFPVRGVLADMGSGSGAGSYDLACLHDGLHVVGVDVAPESVAYAREHYRRPNLEYRLGDIADPIFPPESLDGVLNSSVFHHLTSFNGFSLREVRRSLDNQTAALRPGGVLIIRDFVVPRPPPSGDVLLDLPCRDGQPDGDVATLSTAALFERFCREWRSSQNPDGPVPARRIGPLRPGWLRYRVSHRAAAEFVLRKDYRSDWSAELREEYTYFSQAELEAELRSRGLRVLVSIELHNPWIVENRFRGRFFLYDLDERPLGYPPTNYLIVGEKVGAGAAVAFTLRPRSVPTPAAADGAGFLRLSTFVHGETGAQLELIERPNPVIDLIPWFREPGSGRLFIVGKQGYPRPLVNAGDDSPNLDGAHVAGYLSEPITAMSDDLQAGPETVAELLAVRAGLPGERCRVGSGLRYFTSPGGINERVTSRLVELVPDAAGRLPSFAGEAPNYTAFSSAGRVRPLLAGQLLRAAQVGGLLDARLELNTYHLMALLGEPLGPWIGAEIGLREQGPLAGLLARSDVASVLSPPPRAVYSPQVGGTPRFLDIRRVEAAEVDARGHELARMELEYAMPRGPSTNTALVLPLVRSQGEVYVGLELRDLPAVQAFTGRSRFASAPAWRLPRTVSSLAGTEAWLLQQLGWQFGVRLTRLWPLGGKYYPATGMTPEVVYPLAAEIAGGSVADAALSFVPLAELVGQRHLVEDGHLLIALLRAAHALGVLGA